ncbi:feline leukemia virus subgroup C receptor-related protein 2-like [Photinus pyralis]|uniref:Major facilitator superfamily (MFS) profile domain-containing protein n=1 Tax=Photinus pyralis TaxID=7054 RepID=A0A1Y1L4Y1_PHOPY|nr:feline leukemia virus subgroup C receptor-related protein 2-like [Photinus pyralis]
MADYIRIFGKDVDTEASLLLPKKTSPINLYRRRWLMLFLFVLSYIFTNMQWNEYSVISDIVMKYYNVPSDTVNWTSMISMCFYLPLAIPGSYFLEKYGLRSGILIGAGFGCLGSWIKLFSIQQDKFWVVLVGQGVSAVSGIFIIQLPPMLAAVWFGSEEVSTACSIGIFGGLVGLAIGFYLPSITVPNDPSNIAIANNLHTLSLTIALLGSALFLLQVLFFEDKPPTPPSNTQLNKIEMPEGSKNCIKSCLELLTNVPFLCLVLVFTIDFAIPNAFFVCLNQLLAFYYPNASVEAGRIGPIMIISGIFGAVITGTLLDKFHRYKTQFLLTQTCAVMAIIMFTHALGGPIYVVYFMAVLLGVFWLTTLPICTEAILELTYPTCEGVSIGFSYVVAHLASLIATSGYSYLIDHYNPFWANYLMGFMLCIALLVLITVRFDYRRYAVNFGSVNI